MFVVQRNHTTLWRSYFRLHQRQYSCKLKLSCSHLVFTGVVISLNLSLYFSLYLFLCTNTHNTQHTQRTCDYFSHSISLNIGFYAQTHTTHNTHNAHMCLNICFYAQTHTTHNTHNAHVIISLTLFLLILVSMHKHTQHTTHTTHTCGYFSPSISLNIGFYAQTHTTHTAHMCLFLYFSLYWFLYVNETNMLVSHM